LRSANEVGQFGRGSCIHAACIGVNSKTAQTPERFSFCEPGACLPGNLCLGLASNRNP
jgi:hypothetical protein